MCVCYSLISLERLGVGVVLGFFSQEVRRLGFFCNNNNNNNNNNNAIDIVDLKPFFQLI